MKKIIILMLALTMVFALSVAVSAEEWSNLDVFAPVDDIVLTQNAGWETVEVPVALSEDWLYEYWTISSGAFQVTYDDGITIDSYADGDIPGLINGTPNNEKDIDRFSFSCAAVEGLDFASMYFDNGEISNVNFYTLTFTVPTGKAGTYEVVIGSGSPYFADGDLDKHYVNPVTVSIVVEEATAEENLVCMGRSLLLDGGIAVKAYYTFTDAVGALTATATITNTDDDSVEEVAATLVADDYLANTAYVVIDNVAPKDVDNISIDLVVTDGDYEVAIEDLTVTDYIAAASSTGTTASKNVAKALDVYCKQADIFFNNGTTTAVTLNNGNGLRVWNALTAPSFTGNKVAGGLTFESTSLILKNKITLRHYFKMAAGTNLADYTVEGGKLGQMGSYAYVDIENINAYELLDAKTVTVSDGNATVTVEFAPADYIALNTTNADTNLVNLMKALLIYYYRADAYVG